jgi:enoyl reductase
MQAVKLAMTRRRDLRLAALPLALAVVTVIAVAGPSQARDVTKKAPPSSHTSGGGGTTLSASAGGYTLTYPGGAPSGDAKPLASVDTNWTPPPCWFGPKYSAQQFKTEYTDNFNKDLPGVHGTFRDAMGMDLDHYSKGLNYPGQKGYKDFNVSQEGKGMWWVVTENPDADPMAQMDCNDQTPLWVPNGAMPPAGTGHVITPEMLSKLAYAHTQVPGVTIKTNPVNIQTVNLPTWVRLQQAYNPVHVRASVDLGGGRQIWAETTATATTVHIDPGTADATVFPASGDCPVGAGGKVGADYNGDPKADPPCGVTYLRSTDATGPYSLNVTATWQVTWTGSDGGPNPLPDGRVQQPKQVTVQEIQSVNR